MWIRIALAVLIGLVLSSSVFATSKQDRQERREAVRELHTSLHTFFVRDVAPAVRDLQKSFDASLTPEQLATVVRLRARAAAERKQFRAEIQAIRASKIDSETQHDRIHEARERMHDRRHAIVAELRPILKASREKLEQIATQQEQRFDQWREQAQSIIGAWKQSHPDIRRNGRHGMKPLPLLDGDRRRRAVAFVLWDGTMPDDEGEELGNVMRPSDQRESQASPGSSSAVSPTIEVFDMNGSRVNTVQLQPGQAPPSNASLLASLPSGTYMVSTVDTNGMRRTALVQHTR